VADARGIDASEVLRSQVGLATEVQLTPAVALQANGSLTTEQAAALRRITVVGRETAFQGEDSLQAIAQVFGAAQTETRTAVHAVHSTNTAGFVAISTLDLVVTDTCVNQAVQRNRGFGLSHACEAGGQRNGQ